MIDYTIVIPSYQRHELIKEKTLSFLEKHNIPEGRVLIFVANEDEKVRYEQSLSTCRYNRIVVGVPRISAQRNYMEQEYFDEGTYVVSMDDDLTTIRKKTGENKLSDIENFYEEVIKLGYEKMLETGAKVWGTYAASNPFFMNDRIYTDICYIIASCYGYICERDEFLCRVTEHGEDYEYSIRQYIKNGKLVRFDYITPITKYFGKGGLKKQI